MPEMGTGLPTAKIMLVGDCYSNEDERKCSPFSGGAGAELDRMLHEIGIMRSECYLTNLVNTRPPNGEIDAWIATKKKDITCEHVPFRDKYVRPQIIAGYRRLLKEIELVKPNIIVTFGSAPLWALTGAWGVMKWRGSQLQAKSIWPDLIEQVEPQCEIKLIPTIHPISIIRQWEHRALAVNDLKRAKKECTTALYQNKPNWKFILRPSNKTVLETLTMLDNRASQSPIWIDFDFETKLGHIDCIGLSWSRTEAICIPFMSKQNEAGYWTLEEETHIVYRLYKLLTHPNVWVRGQNLLYDVQYSYRHWHFLPNVKQDTMISQHSCFAGMKKSLDFQASLYCDYYVQWKPDKQAWKEGG